MSSVPEIICVPPGPQTPRIVPENNEGIDQGGKGRECFKNPLYNICRFSVEQLYQVPIGTDDNDISNIRCIGSSHPFNRFALHFSQSKVNPATAPGFPRGSTGFLVTLWGGDGDATRMIYRARFAPDYNDLAHGGDGFGVGNGKAFICCVSGGEWRNLFFNIIAVPGALQDDGDLAPATPFQAELTCMFDFAQIPLKLTAQTAAFGNQFFPLP